MNYRTMPLRKPIALYSILFAGALTALLFLDWFITRKEPPGALVSIIITFISVPPATYMGTSVYQSVRTQTPGQIQPLSQCHHPEEGEGP